MLNAICIVCREPHQIWLDFLNNISYDCFLVINDNVDLRKYSPGKVNMITIDSNISFNNGFNHANRIIQSENDIKKGLVHLPFPEVTAWDKALYYFSSINNKYDNVWFLEDDCFFIDPNIFTRIDSQFNDIDLLVKENNLNYERHAWCWNHVTQYLNEPTAFSFIQACRLSRNLLNIVKNTAKRLKRLVIIETLFNTLVMQNNLSMRHPNELSLLHWDRNLTKLDILDENKIYHPVKNIELHKILRENKQKSNSQVPYNKNNYISNHDLMKLNTEDVWNIINHNKVIRNNFNHVLYELYYRDDLKNRGIDINNLLHHFLFHGLREDYVSNFSFDYDKYRKAYPDLNHLCDRDLYYHQVYNGRIENRIHYIKETFYMKIR